MRGLLILALAALLAACGGGETAVTPAPVVPVAQPEPEPGPAPPTPPPDCSLAAQRSVIRGYMAQQYFWYDQLGAGDAAAASSTAWFDSLLVRPADRFSYSEPTAAFDQFFTEGRRVGYGYALTWEDAARTVLRVRNVEPQSPVAQAGLRRGDVVLSIDGYTPQQVASGTPGAVTQTGIARTIRIRDAAGQQRDIQVVSADFPLTVVPVATTMEVARPDGARITVGYLAYQSFVRYGREPLGAAMRAFAAAGVSELILDMRYNGGGSVMEARDLASMIGGDRTRFGLFAYLRFNPLQLAQNRAIPFTDDAELLPAPSLGLPRVIVIASGSTASASELVINALRPFIPVVLVGSTTYGKPYGFIPRDYCGNTYNAVHFQSLNAEGDGSYTAGFAPTCPVADDLNHALGDPAEARLRTALYYAANDRCPAVPPLAAARARPAPPEAAFGEVAPPRMFAPAH